MNSEQYMSIDVEYDLAIFVCGYETRSRHIAENKAGTFKNALILDYLSVGIHGYDINKFFYNNIRGAKFIDARSPGIELELREKLKYFPEKEVGDPIRVLFDISSCSRTLMARILLEIHSNKGPRIDVSIAYSLAEFYTPPNQEFPSHISEPIIGDLAGWSDDLSKSPCAVIGLGFEPGRAIGCIDYLEIPAARLFLPVGPDPRFIESVKDANSLLIEDVGDNYLFSYDILSPQETYEKLDSLLFGLLERYRPVIIPLGPKIFSAVAIRLALELQPTVCVWRTSSGDLSDPFDVKPSGEITMFKFSVDGCVSQPMEIGQK